MQQKTRGAIAAGHPQTAQAGLEMLKQGGNAFDAALAALLASFVTESPLTSAGGGGFLLAYTQQQQAILFDFFTQTPRRKKPEAQLDFYPVDVDFGGAIQEFHIGLGSMAVPGNLAGVFHVHQRLGKLPMRAIAEPALHYAQSGVEVNAFQAFLLHLLKPILLASEAGRTIYAPSGHLARVGERLFFKDFAQTLTQVIEEGIHTFYTGEIAHRLIQDCQHLGGYLSLEDLQAYQVIERQPLSLDYRGYRLLTNPPPSAGGTLIAFALGLLSQFDLSQTRWGGVEHLQILAEVMRLTNTARQEVFNAQVHQDDIVEKFLALDHLKTYAQQLSQSVNKLGSTTHISAMDEWGNAASVTSSNGEGSGYFIPQTGIMINNMLGEEDLNPFGFHNWQENVRISSMMSPTIAIADNSPKIVLGSGGSNRIRTAILQVISNLIDFQMPADIAVSSPRVHWENYKFDVESGRLTEDELKLHFSDRQQVSLWQQQNMFFGGVHTVCRSATGDFTGSGDPRRSGAIAILD